MRFDVLLKTPQFLKPRWRTTGTEAGSFRLWRIWRAVRRRRFIRGVVSTQMETA